MVVAVKVTIYIAVIVARMQRGGHGLTVGGVEASIMALELK